MFRALIVEDDEDICKFFELALSDAGYQVESSRRGDTALVQLETAVPDVVVLDLHLPGVPGTEVLERIRGDDRLKDTRIIITTSDGRLAKSLRSEADFVLVKPIGYDQLLELSSRLKPAQPLVGSPFGPPLI